MKNPLRAAFDEWRDDVYHGAPMSRAQAQQIESAFFAGVTFGQRVRQDYGDAVVIAGVNEHIEAKLERQRSC